MVIRSGSTDMGYVDYPYATSIYNLLSQKCVCVLWSVIGGTAPRDFWKTVSWVIILRLGWIQFPPSFLDWLLINFFIDSIWIVSLCFIQGLTEDCSLDNSLSVALRGLSEEAAGLPRWCFLVIKNLPPKAGHAGDLGSIPGSGRSPGGGHGNPLR